MARIKLTSEQRHQLLHWLAADYDWPLIRQWFAERGWPTISRALCSYYRHSRDMGIAELRQERRKEALSTGLAVKEERVARLKSHADKLESIKWVPDEHGRLWNEKAWRETVADIAAEMGGRKLVVEHDWRVELKQAGIPEEQAGVVFDAMVAAAADKLSQAGIESTPPSPVDAPPEPE